MKTLYSITILSTNVHIDVCEYADGNSNAFIYFFNSLDNPDKIFNIHIILMKVGVDLVNFFFKLNAMTQVKYDQAKMI